MSGTKEVFNDYPDHVVDMGKTAASIHAEMMPSITSNELSTTLHPELLKNVMGVAHPNITNIDSVTFKGLHSEIPTNEKIGITIGTTTDNGEFIPHGTPDQYYASAPRDGISTKATQTGPFHHIFNGSADTTEKTIAIERPTEKELTDKYDREKTGTHLNYAIMANTFEKMDENGKPVFNDPHKIFKSVIKPGQKDDTKHIKVYEDTTGNSLADFAYSYVDTLYKNNKIKDTKSKKDSNGRHFHMIEEGTPLHKQYMNSMDSFKSEPEFGKNGLTIKAQKLGRGIENSSEIPPSPHTIHLEFERTPTSKELNLRNKDGKTTVKDLGKHGSSNELLANVPEIHNLDEEDNQEEDVDISEIEKEIEEM